MTTPTVYTIIARNEMGIIEFESNTVDMKYMRTINTLKKRADIDNIDIIDATTKEVLWHWTR